MSRSFLIFGVVAFSAACSLKHPPFEAPDAEARPDVALPDAPVDVALPDAPVDVALPDAPDDVTAPDAPDDVARDDGTPFDAADAAVDNPTPDVAADDGPAPADLGAPCGAGQTRCDGACVDLTTDTLNCGACGNTCRDGAACVAGTCACVPGRGDCDGNGANGCEVEFSSAVANCGRCGVVCAARPNSTPACVSGRCAPRCAAGFADCDGDEANGCEVNLNTSVSHCGACGSVCQARPNSTPGCAAGACTFTCAPGSGDCDRVADNGCEVVGFTSPTNCGACGVACAAGRVCNGTTCTSAPCSSPRLMCGTACVDPNTDGAHCGGCDAACPAGQTCVSGRCQCPSGQNVCGGACINLQSDLRNCGVCGAACPTGGSCVGGRCQCPSGQTACAGVCVNLANSSDHCGRCGNSCGLSDACFGGNCGCGGSGQVCCWFRRCATGLSCGFAFCR